MTTLVAKVKTVTTPNTDPAVGEVVGILTVAEMDANINNLATGVTASAGKTENNTFTGTNTFSGAVTVNGTLNGYPVTNYARDNENNTFSGTQTFGSVTINTNLNGHPVANYARDNENNTFTGTQTFNDVQINGTLTGAAVSDYASLSAANAFTNTQTITTSNSFPVTMTSSNASGVAAQLNSTGGGTSTAVYRADTDGTGKAGLQTYTSSTLRGELTWSNANTALLTVGNDTAYTVTSARVHTLTGSDFNFESTSGQEFNIRPGAGLYQVFTDQDDLYIDSVDEVRLRTSSGSISNLRVQATGQQSSTGVGYTSTLYPIIHTRAIGLITSTGSTTWNSNGMTLDAVVAVSDTSLYTFSFSALPTANYGIVITPVNTGATNPVIGTIEGTPTTTGFAIRLSSDTGSKLASDFRIEVKF